jgi:phage terminase small subunit
MARKGKPERPKEDRRARFAEEYAKDLNATQAAIRAGYATRSAHVTGSRLLSDAKVQEMVRSHHSARTAAAGITIDRTIQEIARNAYFDIRKLWHTDGRMKAPHELDDDTAAAVASIEVIETTLFKEEDDAPETGDLFAAENGFHEKTMTRKLKVWDKGRALQQCIEILGMGRSLNPADAGGLSISIFPSSAKR